MTVAEANLELQSFKSPEKGEIPDQTSDKSNNDAKSEEKESPPMSFFKLFKYSTPVDRLLMALGLLGSCGYGAALPSLSILLGDVLQGFIEAAQAGDYRKAESAILTNVYLFTGIGFAVLASCYAMQSCWIIAGERQARRVRSLFIEAVMKQDVEWFDKNAAGDLTTRLTSDTSLFQEGISEKVSQLASYIVTFITGFIIAFISGWKLTLVLLSCVPLLGLSGGIVGKVMAGGTAASQAAYAKAGGVAQETFSNIRTVVAFNGQERAHTKFLNELKDAVRVNIRQSWISGFGFGVFFGVMFGIYALAFYYGSILVNNNEMVGGDILKVLFAVIIGAFSLINIGPALQAVGKARGAAVKLFHVIESKPSIDSTGDSGTKPEKLVGKIEFKNVKFSYPSRPDTVVLKQFNLVVEPGKTVALVGASGSGKSTVIQLLERYYDAASGEILIDGVEIKAMNLKWLRQRVGLVSQEPILFDATIEQNIRYGTPDGVEITQETIEKVCRLANAHDFISKLPGGYQSMVGERGTLLSGGQKQRIAIARALIKDPKVLLLDEATSALDSDSERSVQKALDAAAAGRTTLVIAHRLSTIKNADLIVVMSKGEIKETGTHQELLDKKGYYFNLVTAQELRMGDDSGSAEDSAASDTAVSPSSATFSVNTESKGADVVVDVKGETGDKAAVQIPGVNAEEEARKEVEKRLLKENKVPVFRIYKLQWQDWPILVIGIIAAAVNGAVLPTFGVILGEVLSIFQLKGQALTDKAIFWSLIFVGLMAANFVINVLQFGCFGTAGERLTYRIRSMTFKAMLRQEMGWYDDEKNGTGSLTAQLAEQSDKIQGLTGPNLANILQLCVSIGVAIGIAFYFSWQMTLVVIACAPLFAIGSFFEAQVVAGKTIGKTREAYFKAAQTACDAIQNVRTVKSLTREYDFIQQYINSIEYPYRSGLKKGYLGSLGFAYSQAIQFWVYAIAFYVGYRFLVDGVLSSFNQLLNVLFTVMFGCIAFGQAATFGPNIQKGKIAAISFFKLIDRVPLIDAYKEEGLTPVDVAGQMSLQDIHFAYPRRPDTQILKGLTAEIEPGKVVALVGPSGCGKSTIFGLVQRFYEGSQGSAKVESYDVKEWNLQYLRSQMAIVSQEPSLFIGTIADNIKYSKPDATQEEIEAAAMKANIHDFIMGLPEKYETSVNNSKLSGGQKQRICIARALVRRPKILLLDEATSALDSESEKVVQEALDAASEGRTTVTIAHRLSTIQNADLILVINDGKVAEKGKHEDLLALKGIYHSLVQKQQLGST
ncbi:multidrug resistance protein 1 [Paraphysoderma sedebokerense]|nr:multidrug resistance protein 1 [Paraphysoderma sedebokerense]